MNIEQKAAEAVATAMASGEEDITPGTWMPSVILETPDSTPVIALMSVKPGVPITPGGEGSANDCTRVAIFERSADLRRVIAAIRATDGMPIAMLENVTMMDLIAGLRNAITAAEDASESDEAWAEFRRHVQSAKRNKPKTPSFH